MNVLLGGPFAPREGIRKMLNFQRKFPWIAFRVARFSANHERQKEPLREFVYLDEVSLSSLLASQKGEITDNVTAQTGEALTAEIGGKVAFGVPTAASSEVNSRFQTSNSNALQTVRKANAQSRFRELHQVDGIKKIYPITVNTKQSSIADLVEAPCSPMCFKSNYLKRGDLVEFKVRLSASWIFQMTTMIAEFSDMFDESPSLFIDKVKFLDLYNAKSANKIINKLLAGLIPIDGIASDYSIVTYKGNSYVIHNDSVSTPSTGVEPLKIVGVTEHLAYWKDLRRILFAENEFTMLCRIAKSGLQSDWNPIKVADVFSEFAPDLASQIEVESRRAMTQPVQSRSAQTVAPLTMSLMLALNCYKDKLLDYASNAASEQQLKEIERQIANLTIIANTAEGQRAAFANAKSIVMAHVSINITSNLDLELRDFMRERFDLPLVPRSEQIQASVKVQSDDSDLHETIPPSENLLDVEVVAIYW